MSRRCGVSDSECHEENYQLRRYHLRRASGSQGLQQWPNPRAALLLQVLAALGKFMEQACWDMMEYLGNRVAVRVGRVTDVGLVLADR